MIIRLNKKLLIVAALAVFALLLIVFVRLERGDRVQGYAEAKGAGSYSTEAPDDEAQERLLSRFGISVEKASRRSDSVVIPGRFDSVYTAYNRLQKRIGLDLEPYAGEEAERVTYKIRGKRLRVTLLIFEGHLIGGHISTGVFGERYKALLMRNS